MTSSHYTGIQGTLVTLTLPGKKSGNLDGFWVTGKKKSRSLLIFVHGMGSNFYKSKFKKAWMRLGPQKGLDVFCFNNRGCEGEVSDEQFRNCIPDIDAALNFARKEKYNRIVLLGHSTGCQKITYYQHRRQAADVSALILTAIGDDMAIAKRDLGRDYTRWLKRARQFTAKGKGETRLPPCCLNFSARRFLSAVDPDETEANLFRMDGDMRIFSRLKLPLLAVFPEKEQYACMPVNEMANRLKIKSASSRMDCALIPEADHSFHRQEERCVMTCLQWLRKNRLY